MSSPPRGLVPSSSLGTPASSLRFGALRLQAHPALPASSSSGDEINAVVAEYERDKESLAYVHVRRALLAPLRPSPPRALLTRSGSSGSSGSGGGGGGAPLQGSGASALPPRSSAPLLFSPPRPPSAAQPVVDWEAWRPRWPASSLPFPSEEQRAIASCILSGTSTIVQAVAGAGKTTSMLQTAVLLAREQPASCVLICCYNRMLREGSHARVQSLVEGGHLVRGAVSCYTLHALAQSLYGVECKDDNGLRLVCEDNLPLRNCKRFTHVMVDEAQDLTPLLFSVLLKVSIDLAKHAGTGLVFAVFGDPMQTVYAFRASSSGYLTHADALLAPGQRWERLPLRTTNRLTANMTDFLNCVIHQRFSYLVPRKGPGEPVHLYLGCQYDSQGKIQHLLGNRFAERKFKPSDLMIIVPSTKPSQSSGTPLQRFLNGLSEKGMPVSVRQDDVLKVDDSNQVIVTTRNAAKGLERPVVVVFGLSTSHAHFINKNSGAKRGAIDFLSDERCDSIWHVAMTRAQEELHIIGHSGRPCPDGSIDYAIPFLNVWAAQRLQARGALVVHGEPAEPACGSAAAEDDGPPPILVRQLLEHLSAAFIAQAMACLAGLWVQLPALESAAAAGPPRRIMVPDMVNVPWGDDRIEQAVAHLTGIAIPAMLAMGASASASAAAALAAAASGGAAPQPRLAVHLYEELRGHFGGLDPAERAAHPLYKTFCALRKPHAGAPPAWFLECASLWHACASVEQGLFLQHKQLMGSDWNWLTAQDAAACLARLRAHIPEHASPEAAAEVVLESEVRDSQGLRSRGLTGQLDVVTPRCVWELKSYSKGDLRETDKLQLALYAYLWRCEGRPPTAFKLLNVLSGEQWELQLTREPAAGEGGGGGGGEGAGLREWVPERCAALQSCAQLLIDHKLLPKQHRSAEEVVAWHAGDRARFESGGGSGSWGGGSASLGASGGGGGDGGGGGGAGAKRPRS